MWQLCVGTTVQDTNGGVTQAMDFWGALAPKYGIWEILQLLAVGELEGQREEDGGSEMPHLWWHGTWLCRHTGTHGRGSGAKPPTPAPTEGGTCGGVTGRLRPSLPVLLLSAPRTRGCSCHWGPWGQWWPR